MQRISWVAAQLTASKEELSSVNEWVNEGRESHGACYKDELMAVNRQS
jgi:hypothetical protein